MAIRLPSPILSQVFTHVLHFNGIALFYYYLRQMAALLCAAVMRSTAVVVFDCIYNKKAQLSLTNPRDACKKFARFTYEQWGCKL